MRVNIVCRNLRDDRVIPRFSRYLSNRNGWILTARPVDNADIIYLSGYFEIQMIKQPSGIPMAAYFTHREEEGSGKARLFDQVAERVDLRIATAGIYRDYLSRFGPTVQILPPVELNHFTIPKNRRSGGSIVAGFSGYSYRSGRKGEKLAADLVRSTKGIEWKASGRGWSVPTVRYPWEKMAEFYGSLDILVVTSLIEGVPMPPLEALACGVSVVIPRGVGLLDELPDEVGIHRYERGNLESLKKAFNNAVRIRSGSDPVKLREVVLPFTIDNWCDQHKDYVEGIMDDLPNAGIESREMQQKKVIIKSLLKPEYPIEKNTGSERGIYIVAFGDPARRCASSLMESIKRHMPEIPVCLCASRKIGLEDILIREEDSDIGGRRAKLKAYSNTPAEWKAVLYLDADTVVVGDIRFYFQLIEDGWEFVICKDPHLMDTMHAFRRHNNMADVEETQVRIKTLHTLQYNGGVWAFGRNERVARFFARWRFEWEKLAQRDQGALIRAMYADPLKVYLLGNEWNTFPKYTKGIKTAGLMHYPGKARRWTGIIPGRIDSETAWAAVKRFERIRGKR